MSPFTQAQEARLREILREEAEAFVAPLLEAAAGTIRRRQRNAQLARIKLQPDGSFPPAERQADERR